MISFTRFYKRKAKFLLLAGSLLGIELSVSLVAGMLLYTCMGGLG
ncbi:MAG: hypothetical protein ACOX8J_01860 [Candidatus Merdisoma sp.]